ncbi:MAG: hypothetical protein IPH06_00595 [Alphaproteobacteria bacterium]|jgi:hypothetical protein|nr:hypothetical protein [Alphaproteobacteria bacterium]QQS56572.1 MAG: hypothetical protein IPN28_09845 [Alphaproteobacteria bacterium]
MNDMHNKLLIAIIGAVVIVALLTIMQVWGPVLPWNLYYKIVVTAVIVAVVCGFMLVARSDMVEKKKLKDENYLD